MTTRTFPRVLSLKDSGVVTARQLLVLLHTPFSSHCRVSPVPSGTTRHRSRRVPSAFFTDRAPVLVPSETTSWGEVATWVEEEPSAVSRTRTVGLPIAVDRV